MDFTVCQNSIAARGKCIEPQIGAQPSGNYKFSTTLSILFWRRRGKITLNRYLDVVRVNTLGYHLAAGRDWYHRSQATMWIALAMK